jgi:hypothetical protein
MVRTIPNIYGMFHLVAKVRIILNNIVIFSFLEHLSEILLHFNILIRLVVQAHTGNRTHRWLLR